MARQLIGDEMYRVVVVKRERRDNPDWERGNLSSRRFLHDGPEFEQSYGPYASIGTARGQLTWHTVDDRGEPHPGVVSGRIERAAITWEVVK